MKKISEILSHLKNNPEFRKINTSTLVNVFINTALLEKHKKCIKFGYIKNKTLFFVLKHQGYKKELEYNKADIKSLLKKFNLEDIENIEFFVTNVIEKKESKKEVEPMYKERSYGIFENKAKDEMIFKKFEKIREIIKNS